VPRGELDRADVLDHEVPAAVRDRRETGDLLEHHLAPSTLRREAGHIRHRHAPRAAFEVHREPPGHFQREPGRLRTRLRVFGFESEHGTGMVHLQQGLAQQGFRFGVVVCTRAHMERGLDVRAVLARDRQLRIVVHDANLGDGPADRDRRLARFLDGGPVAAHLAADLVEDAGEREAPLARGRRRRRRLIDDRAGDREGDDQQ
jgi:hypothetical protein